ncbi:hypothetical protein SAMN05444166_0289 [Singulisphaera sp. GP187]|uniref:hypothetical protein n=1 Tax=Singulisphaera sp. GP187 TaxID=1882752 RepID=UPI00092ADADE|nr:hypothetical protein [Singulisphaera sp. GP187]SIN70732.1 hypothetical protein SAMN05444166_0289 [Singulisphaera sp. GP187]
MPPQAKSAPSTPKGVASPGLPPHRSEAIANLTAQARKLQAEHADNADRADKIAFRQAAIHRELTELRKQVLEHAWDGNPPC